MGDRCHSCDQPVRWVQTETGRALLINAEQVGEVGNLTYLRDNHGHPSNVELFGHSRKVVRYVRKGERFEAGTPRFLAHFATCPKADQHRRPRSGPDDPTLW